MSRRRRPAGRLLVAAVATIGLGIAPFAARAQTSAPAPRTPAAPGAAPLLELEWSAPEGCPDRAHVVARVEALVGARRAGQHALSARGGVTSLPGTGSPRYRLDLFAGGQDATTRTMSGDDCARLAEAAALILALDIDPDAGSRGEEEPPAGATAPEQVEPERPALRAPPRTPPLRLARPRRAPPPPPPEAGLPGFAGARVLFDSGSLPRPTLGAAAAFELVRGPLALDLQGAAFEPQFTVSGPHHGVGGAYVSLATFGAHACAGGVAGEVDFRGCLGGELGREATTGVSIAHPESSASLWSAASAMLRARVFPELPIAPTVGVAVVRPLTAATVQIQGFGTVFEPPAVLIRLFLGVEAHLF